MLLQSQRHMLELDVLGFGSILLHLVAEGLVMMILRWFIEHSF